MAKKSTTEEFIEKAKLVHGDIYDYSLADYKGAFIYVKLICHKHGIFPQTPTNHLSGRGCPTCGKLKFIEAISSNTKEFIRKAKLVHGTKYDYSLVDYKKNNRDVKIICQKHGVFEQLPSDHLQGCGCTKCASLRRSLFFRSTIEDFIEKAKSIHGDKYDYSLVDYKTAGKNVEIICPEHGIFPQTPASHLRGSGCPTCADGVSNTEEFIEKAKLVHGDTYDYSLVDYKSARIKVEIICHKHGIFEQVPNDHLKGSGCNKCNESKGENYIRDFLIKNKIKYIKEKRFVDCKYKNPLPFDFYLPEYKIFIEFQGEQHTQYVEYFHRAEKKFLEQIEKDKIKKEYAMNNGIYMEIHYNDDINARLDKLINHINSVEST